MAQHKSAEKRIRRNNRANTRNSTYLAGVRTAVKKFRAAIAAGDAAAVKPLLENAQSLLAKAATKGIIHQNNAARKIGRLALALKTLQNAPTAGEAAAAKAAAKKTASAAKKSAASSAKPAAKKAAAPAKKAPAKKK